MKAKVTLYANKYQENGLVRSILNKDFGFELNLEDEYLKCRYVLNLEQLKEL